MATWAAGLFLALISAQLHAQPAASSGHWQIDWGDQRCSLIRHGAGSQPLVVLRTIPGSRIWEIMLVAASPGTALPRGANINVRLLPSNAIADGLYGSRMRDVDVTAGPALSVGGLSREFVDAFATSRSISAGDGANSAIEVPIPGGRQAVAALRECETEAMQRWGIDVAAFEAVSIPASANTSRLFTDADYPAEALRTGLFGDSIVRTTIDVNGRVTECGAVAGSNVAILDATTCRILRDRARFSLARDASGNAISTQLVVSIRWRIYSP